LQQNVCENSFAKNSKSNFSFAKIRGRALENLVG
jgi:hypothetical protein